MSHGFLLLQKKIPRKDLKKDLKTHNKYHRCTILFYKHFQKKHSALANNFKFMRRAGKLTADFQGELYNQLSIEMKISVLT